MTTTVLAYIPSPPQGVWYLGPFPLRAYALCIIVGIVAALVIGDRRWVARGGEPGVIYDIALWAVPFGLIGGRLYHVITDWPTYFGDGGAGPAAALRIWDGGLGIWGAVALGAVGAWIACRRRGIPLPAFGDAIAPGIVLAQAIGRLGNYFNQELYGRETTVPWGLEIYERRNSAGVLDSLNGISTGELIGVVHPTFLYELLWNLLVFAVLILVDRRFKIGHGRLFALYVAGYCAGRFWIELMRSDTATLLAGIRVNTFTATFVFVAAVVYVIVAPKGREAPESLRGNQDAESDVEDLAKDVALASAVGVVAAATVAGEDEKRDGGGSPPGGLGSVEGDEALEAAGGASAANESAVEGAADAADLVALLEASEDVEAADGATEPEEVDAPPVPDEAGGLGAVEGEEAAEAAAGAGAARASVSDDAEALTDADADAEAAGLGSVDGDEVAAAVEDAPEVHEAAVEGEAEAEELAAEAEVEAVAAEVAEVDADALTGADDDVDAETEAAVEGEAEAEELAAEADAEAQVAAEVAEVDADALTGADDDVDAETEAEVEGEAEAEELAAEADAEAQVAAEVAEVDAETLTGADKDVDAEALTDADAETEAAGLGSVDGDEVAAAVEDAPEVHEAAVEGESEAEELAAEADAEALAEVAEIDAEAVNDADEDVDAEAEAEAAGLGSVDGDEVAAAVEDAPEVREAVEGVAEVDAEALTDAEPEESDAEGEPEGPALPTSEHSPYTVVTESSSEPAQSGPAGLVRQWIRRRRNR
ncbi:prolipoprotein diacylglyceryl transferase [Mycolicibacterium gilvum]|uniref:prolipoprotein diacylglyceryl transferase n=1 Tax=Mycolicibacterium gilvum TaxID=1804 RepID=UPI0040467F15